MTTHTRTRIAKLVSGIAFLACCSRDTGSSPRHSGADNSNARARTLLQNKGSDTLANVAQAWAEAYKDVDPKLAVAVTGGGSGTGLSSLINGTADIANASLRISTVESSRPHIGAHDTTFAYASRVDVGEKSLTHMVIQAPTET
ncbi:MAG: substrate-binding domain-containing protein, partial [Nannocystaceae bacterium]